MGLLQLTLSEPGIDFDCFGEVRIAYDEVIEDRGSSRGYRFAQLIPDSSECQFLICLFYLRTTPPRPPQDPLHLISCTHVLILPPLIASLSDSSSGLLQAPLQENDLWCTNHTTPLTSRWGPKS